MTKDNKWDGDAAPSSPRSEHVPLRDSFMNALASAFGKKNDAEEYLKKHGGLFPKLEFKPGEVVLSRGPIECAYLIDSGAIVEMRHNDVSEELEIVRELHVGHLVGPEFLTKSRYVPLDLVAKTKVVAYRIDDETLNDRHVPAEIQSRRAKVINEALARNAVDLNTRLDKVQRDHARTLADFESALATESTRVQDLEAEIQAERLVREGAQAQLATAQQENARLTAALTDAQEAVQTAEHELKAESELRCAAEEKLAVTEFAADQARQFAAEQYDDFNEALAAARAELEVLKHDRLAQIERDLSGIRADLKKHAVLAKSSDSAATALIVGVFNQSLSQLLKQIPADRQMLALQGCFERWAAGDNPDLRDLGFKGIDILHSRSSSVPS